MKAVRAAVAGALVAAGIVGLAPTPSAIAAGQLTLVSQTFNVAADGQLRFVVEFPDDIQVTAVPSATMVVTAYRAVATREAVADALAGTLPRSADSVDLPLVQLSRAAANTVQGVVQLESTTRTPESLQLAQPGLYPLTLEVRDGNEVVAEVITFVNRLPTPDTSASSSDDLRVALAMRTTTPVRLGGEGGVIMDDEVIGELTHLADLLDAIAQTDVPLAISVPPAWLAALAANDQVELADRLATGLTRHELLSAPRLPLDASQAADAGQQALYTEWLRDGDDILAAAVPNPSRRSITFVESPISQGGAALHRVLGSRLLVIPRDLYDQLPNSLGTATDTSRLLTIEMADGVRIDATVPDRHASELMTIESDHPAHNAILLVADLLAARQELIDDEVVPSRRAITLAAADLSLPPPSTLAAIVSLIDATPGLNATTFDDFVVRTDQLTDDGDLVVIGLPTTVGGTLAARLAPLPNLESEADATASMLPTDDPRLADWRTALDELPTSAFTDAQVALIVADIREQLQVIRNSVEIPPAFKFTLTGRRTTVPIKLRNASDSPLTVKVRLTAAKLLFPDGDQTVTLPPQAFFDVEVPIEVRSNGSFTVTLEVFTPTGDLRLAPPVRLTARVNAISGLGNLVTGALLLVVMTWWARHVRQNWRRRAALKASLHHPLRGSGNLTNL